jgi:hypothetical protein
LGLALDFTKVITRYYYLTTIDINAINVMTPVFDDGAYFIVLKIDNFIEGKISKVDMLKVS